MKHIDICTECLVFVAAILLVGSACDTTTTFHEAQLSGVPDCAPGQVLRRSMCVRLEQDARHYQSKIFSSFARVAPSISLPDETRTWMLRAGVCENERSLNSPSYRCGECRFYWELEVTTQPDTTRLAVPPPADAECIGGVVTDDSNDTP